MFTLLFNFFSRSIIVLLIAMLSVNYVPDKFFHDFPLEPRSVEPNNYETVIPEWNTKLSDGSPEFIQLNNILGPESVAISKSGLIYTGLADGRIVELDPSKNYKLRKVLRAKDSPNCPDNIATRSDECGRFLQMRFVNDTLYAVEANTGLYKINTKAGTKTFIGPNPSLNKINMFNSFAFDPKEPNLVYLTVSSTRWSLLSIIWSLFEMDASGQIVALDVNTGKRAIVVDKLFLTNGIDVDDSRDRLLFAETASSRIRSVPLQDVRASFVKAKDGDKLSGIVINTVIPLLPGNPDNIIVEGDLAYIALPFVKLNGKELIDHLSTMPNVRKALGRFQFAVGKALEYVCVNFYHHPSLEHVYKELKCGHFNYHFMPKDRSAIVEYNLARGSSRLLGSETFGCVSEAVPDNNGNLYLGSFRSPFLVKQKI